MVTYRTRIDVWRRMADVAWLGYRFRALADRHRRNHAILRVLLIAAAMGGIAALLAALPQTVPLAACGAVAIVAVWDLAADYARKAAVPRAVGSECSSLEIEWRELWAAIDREGADDAGIGRRNLDLARRLDRAAARAVDAGVGSAPASMGNARRWLIARLSAAMPPNGTGRAVSTVGLPRRPSHPTPPPPPPPIPERPAPKSPPPDGKDGA